MNTPNVDTMTVTVRDRGSESPWGSGPVTPRPVRVSSAYCPQCGQRRGEPRDLNQCDDGAYYWVQIWTNPCGHIDHYKAVIAEAATRVADTV